MASFAHDAPNNAVEARDLLNGGKPALIWRTMIADTETPIGAATKLIAEGRGDFLLESVEGGASRGRYSLLGLNPDLVFRATGNDAAINREWRSDRDAFVACSDASLSALRELVADCRIDTPETLPPALACLVGYFGYETMALVEKLPEPSADGLGLPDMLFVRPTQILVFDGLTEKLFAIAPLWPTGQLPEEQIAAAAEQIDVTLNMLFDASPRQTQAQSLENEAPELTSMVDPGNYADMVAQAKEYIEAGDVFQVVLAQRFTTTFTLPPLDLYRALRRINPSPFLYFLDLPGFALVGSSPEILVRVRDGEVTVRPIAGTRPRGDNEAEDREAQESLLSDPKECAEHLMLLDLGRNDVGRVSQKGSVTVTDSFSVERYSHVMHIVSNVIGQLAPDRTALDALFAGFPAGTVSGAPKIRACQIIAELEPEKRGPYAGGVGYFAPDGSIDSCIILRTGVVKDQTLHIQAGAGIVADSEAEYEKRECEAKAGALIAAAKEAVRIAHANGGAA